MIGRIQGVLLEKQAPDLLVDVNGVGYDILSPMTSFYRLPAVGETVTLHTHLAVSETAHTLFGFVDRKDRELFRMLIKVNGVGPKLAIGIMSMEAGDFVRCVMQENLTALVKLPGVGKKTAERLLVDMRDRLKDWNIPSATAEYTDDGAGDGAIVRPDPAPVSGNAMIADAESALIALGYKPAEASKAVSAVYDDSIQQSEELIRLALKGMIRP